MRYEEAPAVAQELYDQQMAREGGKPPAPTGKKEPVGETTLIHQMQVFGVDGYVRHYPSKDRGESWPAPTEKRRWSFDFAWVGMPPHGPSYEARHLGVWLHGSAHGHRSGDGLKDEKPGKRGRDYEAANVLGRVLPPLGWTLFTFSNQQVGSLVALRSIQAWLAGDDAALLEALQGRSER